MTGPRVVGALPVPRELLAAIRYAEFVITIGVSPDDPESLRTTLIERGGAAVCLHHHAAAALRELADNLDSEHGTDPCAP